MGIAKRSGADLWQRLATALHENTQTGPGETRARRTRANEDAGAANDTESSEAGRV